MKASNLMMPGNPRYQPRILRPYFGYDNNYSFVAMVQLAAMEVLAELDYIPASDYEQLTNGIKSKILAITTTDVDERERNVTHHDIRALIQLIQEILPQPLQRWIHLLLTSYDPLDTSRILQYKQAHLNVVKPKVQELIGILIAKIEEFSETVQIGRTHGQHAIPITVGFWLATILDRVICNAVTADAFEKNLVGKISGAVGAYNAQAAMGVLGKCEEKFGVSFERMVLSKLDLRPARISTQILPPEPLAYYLFSMHMLSMSLSQLGRDCRHLMRTEIGEIVEPFEATQVGSSTMAHKRNPFRFEGDEGAGVKSKHAFGKVLDNMISEHQRDLVGSALVRDFPEIVVLLVYQLDSIFLRRKKEGEKCFLERITIDQEALKRNLQMKSDVFMAEPVYIALQMAGYEGDAHDLVNHKAMELVANRHKITVLEALQILEEDDRELYKAYRNIPREVMSVLEAPESYIGVAAEKAKEICQKGRSYLSGIPTTTLFR